jgi:hypothetical protein
VRGYLDGVFVSTAPTPLRLRVAPEFEYLGSFVFDLDAVARVERHLFVDAADRSVRRMIVLHFEAFLPGVDDFYRYRLPAERVLGGDTYGRTAGTLSVREERAASPHAEMAHTATFVESKGLVLPDQHAVARYARIIGADRRRELLIFYHEIDGQTDGILDRAERAFEISPA